MIKLVIFILIVAAVLGVITYENDKVVIHTDKGKEVLHDTKKFINDNVEVK